MARWRYSQGDSHCKWPVCRLWCPRSLYTLTPWAPSQEMHVTPPLCRGKSSVTGGLPLPPRMASQSRMRRSRPPVASKRVSGCPVSTSSPNSTTQRHRTTSLWPLKLACALLCAHQQKAHIKKIQLQIKPSQAPPLRHLVNSAIGTRGGGLQQDHWRAASRPCSNQSSCTSSRHHARYIFIFK